MTVASPPPRQVRWDFRGARVLVTGGTSGIGLAIAQAYAQAGAEVVVTGTRAQAADYGLDLRAFQYQPWQLGDAAGTARLVASLERLDILVNNAGLVWPNGAGEDDPDVFDEALRLNLGAAFRLAQGCRPLLARSALPAGGCVVGLASMTSYFGSPVVPGYGAAKAGLVQATKTLAVAWAAERIRVNAVAAGLTATRMTAAHVADTQALAPVLARTPLARVGEPAEIAQAVLFLTSDAAAWITGQTLAVDGGYSVA